MRLYVNHNENEDTDRIDTTQIDLGLSMDTNIMNINSVSVWWYFDVLSNT